ncbi:uncharacterized protein BDV17DRAFT_274187 [Aspergillus undulatus]|uniref:uncharacterized protein n=1 Tax=Aspergillus undulatus TaxID=1810928 RepID=UPI003CCCCB52
MRSFWKSPWMRSNISLGDGQRDHLLPGHREIDQLSAKETPSQAAVPRERYVGFGIGGAGNIRKVKPRGDGVKAVSEEAKGC